MQKLRLVYITYYTNTNTNKYQQPIKTQSDKP